MELVFMEERMLVSQAAALNAKLFEAQQVEYPPQNALAARSGASLSGTGAACPEDELPPQATVDASNVSSQLNLTVGSSPGFCAAMRSLRIQLPPSGP